MEFKMPDIGEGVAEGEIVKWLVKEGDVVAEDQPMLEASTDKATVVIPCPTSGVVQKIFVAEGGMAKVGQVLVTFGGQGGAASAPSAPAAKPVEAPAPVAEAPRAVAPPPQPVAAPAPAPVAVRAESNGRSSAPPVPVNGSAASARVLAAPATRRLAREAGVDLAHVHGTGPNGRVTREDLLSYLESGAPAPQTVVQTEAAPAAAPSAAPQAAPAAPAFRFPEGPRPEQRIPARGVRRKIIENMRRSKDHAAHFTFVEECDFTELVKLRADSEDIAKSRGVKLSYLPFIVKAVVAALKEFPTLNSSYDEQTQEIVLKGYYNIGIAASTDDGLMVPVLKDADRRTILEIGAEIARLAEGARNRRLTLDELQGSTFTITSLGALGGIMATPVINYPEVAIMGVHKIRKRPVVKNDEIVVREMGYITCSFDHRIIDGDVGAKFVMRVVQLLEDPRLLILGA